MKRIDKYGTIRYYNDEEQLHREDGPAFEYSNGYKAWYLNGKLHRENGPSINYSNFKAWYINGQLHREDGPAIEYVNGDKEYWINNNRINSSSQEEFLRLIKMKAFW